MNSASDATGIPGGRAKRLLAAAVLLLAASVSCSVGELLTGRQQPAAAPTATFTPRPTFTPLPGATESAATRAAAVRGALPPGVTAQAPGAFLPLVGAGDGTVTPVAEGEEGAINIVLYATETPPATPTPEPAGPPATATPDVETNRPTREAGPRPLPTPYVVISVPTLNGRRGPGTAYERIGQAKQGTELMIMARTEDSSWWQVCCMANQPVWVAAEYVDARGPLDAVPAILPPPTAFPTLAPPPPLTPTPTPTPQPPFDIARGPEFPMKRDNGVLTIWVKVYEGPLDNMKPLGGYILKVFRNGADVSDNIESFGDRPFDRTNPSEGLRDYNLKFEMYHAGEAEWRIYLARPGGFRVSPETVFTTTGDSYRNLVVYIAYWLAR